MQASSKLEVVSTLMVDVETKGKNYLNFYNNCVKILYVIV